jgi:esterase
LRLPWITSRGCINIQTYKKVNNHGAVRRVSCDSGAPLRLACASSSAISSGRREGQPAMDLAFRDFGGSGPPILFLHGLFGSAQNWASVGRGLAAHGRCIGLDMRNHGRSPHAASHSLADCVADLREWAARHAEGPVRMVGHSLGGLAAMGFAIAHPDLTEAVAVIDIAPRAYPLDHQQEFAALRTDLGGCASRAELDALLAPLLPDQPMRQFLLTNAVRSEDGRSFRWQLNVAGLAGSET